MAGKFVKAKHITLDQVLEHCKTLEQAPAVASTFVALLAHSMGKTVVFSGVGADKVQTQWNNLVA